MSNFYETDDDRKAATFAQYDSILQCLGHRAPGTWSTEGARDYRRRCARMCQGLVEPFQKVRMDSLDADTFDAIEGEMLRRLEDSAKATADRAVGRLIPIKRRDETGRTITEFRGDMNTWLSAFKTEPKRIRFRKPKAVSGVIVGVQ